MILQVGLRVEDLRLAAGGWGRSGFRDRKGCVLGVQNPGFRAWGLGLGLGFRGMNDNRGKAKRGIRDNGDLGEGRCSPSRCEARAPAATEPAPDNLEAFPRLS